MKTLAMQIQVTDKNGKAVSGKGIDVKWQYFVTYLP